MVRRNGLGRGLGALIPTEATGERGSHLRDLPIAVIRPNALQPRKFFDEESLASLAASIRELGVLQPILVRPLPGEDGDDPSGYELIAGERRWRAARRAGLQSIPALVQQASDLSSLEQALVENLHRTDLNPLEEAAAYRQLIEDFNLTHDELARRVGKSRAAISNTLRLIQLPTIVQRYLREGALTQGHARALLGTPDRESQEELAQITVDRGLSVRALEEAVRETLHRSELPLSGSESEPEQPISPVDRASSEGRDEGRSPAEAPGAIPWTPTPSTVEGAEVGRWPRREYPGNERDLGTVRAAGMLELERLLADYLDTRVRVETGARHGRILIDFATLEDLERIYRVIIDGQATSFSEGPAGGREDELA
jgi:ParB family chromosome partitioning protein